MPEIPLPAESDRLPPLALQAATDELTAWMLKWCWLPDLTAAQHREVCREAASRVLDVGAPILAEAVAQAILRHADKHEPKPGSATYLAWHRYFGIAARVAAGAFTTEAESKRMAAEALAAGQYVACPLPEDGVPHDA